MNGFTRAVRIAVLIAGTTTVGCADDDGDAAFDGGADVDGGVRSDGGCDEGPRLGCPCAPIGTVMCRSPGPDLYCAAGTWIASADGPCPGLDAGGQVDAGSDVDGGTGADASASADAGRADDASTGTDAGVDAGADAGVRIDAGADAGPAAMATYCVDIDVSSTCVMSVTPAEITIPPGQTAYFCWRNRSSAYPVDVWLSYGGGYTDLAPGATWNEPVGHCIGPTARTEYADISTACSEHRFLIRCL